MALISILKYAAGISTAISLIAFIAALFIWLLARRKERSISELIKGEGIVDKDAVINILKEFQNDEHRLKALQKCLGWDKERTAAVLNKIKPNIDAEEFSKEQHSVYQRVLIIIGCILVILAIILYLAPLFIPNPSGIKDDIKPLAQLKEDSGFTSFAAHDYTITALAVNDYTFSIATADRKGFIKIWQWTDDNGFKLTKTIKGDGEIDALSFSPKGTYIAAGGYTGVLQIWLMSPLTTPPITKEVPGSITHIAFLDELLVLFTTTRHRDTHQGDYATYSAAVSDIIILSNIIYNEELINSKLMPGDIITGLSLMEGIVGVNNEGEVQYNYDGWGYPQSWDASPDLKFVASTGIRSTKLITVWKWGEPVTEVKSNTGLEDFMGTNLRYSPDGSYILVSTLGRIGERGYDGVSIFDAFDLSYITTINTAIQVFEVTNYGLLVCYREKEVRYINWEECIKGK